MKNIFLLYVVFLYHLLDHHLFKYEKNFFISPQIGIHFKLFWKGKFSFSVFRKNFHLAETFPFSSNLIEIVLKSQEGRSKKKRSESQSTSTTVVLFKYPQPIRKTCYMICFNVVYSQEHSSDRYQHASHATRIGYQHATRYEVSSA